MSAARLSPAQRNVLLAICVGGLRDRSKLPPQTIATLEALRTRGLLDKDFLPTTAGRAVFPQAEPAEERRPGISVLAARLARENPGWSIEQVSAQAKHLYTNRGVQC